MSIIYKDTVKFSIYGTKTQLLINDCLFPAKQLVIHVVNDFRQGFMPIL